MKEVSFICGFGHVGHKVFYILQSLGHEVYIVSKDSNDEWVSRCKEYGAHYIQGDAKNINFLKEVGIEKSDNVFIVTDNDLINISISIDIHKLQTKTNIVVRLFEQDLGEILGDVINSKNTVSISEVSAVNYALHG